MLHGCGDRPLATIFLEGSVEDVEEVAVDYLLDIECCGWQRQDRILPPARNASHCEDERRGWWLSIAHG